MKAITLFGGPGGVSTGLNMAGITDTLSIEIDPSAVATATAAGHRSIQADVQELDPHAVVASRFGTWDTRIALVQASPPCQGLSMAGEGKGRDDLEALFSAINYLVTEAKYGEAALSALQSYWKVQFDHLVQTCSDERSPLTFEAVRWILELLPEYIMFEQVPAALPIWEAIGELLKALGYGVWVGNVQAEQFGVPQTRKRAILLAGMGVEVTKPEPTHSKYHTRTPSRLDEGVLPWVSMAEALGWGFEGVMVSNYGSGGDPAKRGERTLTQPAPTVTSKIGRNKIKPTHFGDVVSRNGSIRPVETPAPSITSSADNGNFRFIDKDLHSDYLEGRGVYERINRKELVEVVTPRVNNQSGTEFDLGWPMDRPSPVIAGRGLVTMPGANANRFNGSTKSGNDGIRVTVQEAGVLQSFPADYPWQGTKTQQFQQVGNAVPPLLQQVLTTHLIECAHETPGRASA